MRPIEVKEVTLEPGVTAWTVDSTPADCVRLAVLGLKREFDLVISGVNRGLNLGVDTMYSGTVAAASEAVNLGMKAVALSTPFDYYDHATDHLDQVLAFFEAHKLLERHNFYNVNIPAAPKGIRITRLGGPYYSDDFPLVGDDLYQPKGKPVWSNSGDLSLDTDATLGHGSISVTPMTIDKTCRSIYQSLKDAGL